MRLKSALFAAALIIALGTLVPAQNTPKADYDLLIKNGLVYDGSLAPPARLDVAVKGDRIVKIAPSIDGTAARVVDASGMIVTPGFIDLHTHVDEGMYFPENRSCLNFLLQGVTSVIVGQCGGSAWPIFEKAEDLIATWTREGIGPNAALLVGHGQVRNIVMGMENRAPTPAELEKMKWLVKEAMDQGASGFSTGLIYTPGSYSKTDEVIALAKVVAPYGGIYHTHIRNERDKLIEAVKEAIQISETAGLPAHISHFKAMGRANWGLVKEACAVIEAAQARGLKITADQYPFRFSNGNPYSPLVPRATWASGSASERLSARDIAGIFEKLSDTELIDLYKKVTPFTPISERQTAFLTGLPHPRLVQYVAPFLLGAFRFPGRVEHARARALPSPDGRSRRSGQDPPGGPDRHRHEPRPGELRRRRVRRKGPRGQDAPRGRGPQGQVRRGRGHRARPRWARGASRSRCASPTSNTSWPRTGSGREATQPRRPTASGSSTSAPTRPSPARSRTTPSTSPSSACPGPSGP